ncbi:alpha/beta hydrolase [Micromonospora sp. NBC_01655]|uniref:alpha/beta fold hydrolase n=1 Tax=Micromonospora sp. NBC_01655 TaxID=2975983 RepID=UPI00224CCAC8|nr:alpha/beta hydrolase [Micromonospora sp. NBC_01655]MCX4469561.1 alpha/beta hydrolase [Micromonospora sp. NBC_01655]
MTGTSLTEGRVRSADGTIIAYERSGEGPPIVLVGGAFNDRSTTRALAAALAPNFTVFGYDRRGRGDSGDTAPYAVQREIEDIAALVGAAGGAAHLYGLSSGAILAALATAAGLPVTGLALFEPPFTVGPHAGSRRPIAGRLAELLAADRRADAVECFMVEAVGLPAEQARGMRQQPMWPGLEALAPTLVHDTTITGDGDLPADRLAAIDVPTVVVDSTASPQWLRDATRATAEAVPGARYVSLEGGFHEVPPERLAAELRRGLIG